jgi:cell division protein FtsZ
MDMSIGEFQEVGAIVREFASEDATVVVGTVIDPEMQDELRVTVVATGLNRQPQQQQGRNNRDGFASYREPAREPVNSREQSRHGSHSAHAPQGQRRPAPTLAPVANDYANLDKPAVQRFARAVGDGMGPATVDEELLDIPAFLRRQAD